MRIPLRTSPRDLDAPSAVRSTQSARLQGIGVEGQQRIGAARVLVVGAGGLGSPVLQYLAAAGVGALGIVDPDVVDATNLGRQVVHPAAAVGEAKVRSAARSVAAINPGVVVETYEFALDAENAAELLSGYDLVVDATDRPASRYLVSDAAAALRMPEVWGAVLGFEGQVAVFWEGAPDGRSLDYRDLHPREQFDADSCETVGVLGPACGVIGSAMAVEALKLITGAGDPLLGRVQHYDAASGSWRELALRRRSDRVPLPQRDRLRYGAGAPTQPTGSPRPPSSDDEEASRWLSSDEGAYRSPGRIPPDLGVTWADRGNRALIDVREPHEHAAAHLPGDRLVPLDELLADPGRAGSGPVLVYCATGRRSARAAAALVAVGIDAVSLRGGIAAVAPDTSRSPDARTASAGSAP